MSEQVTSSSVENKNNDLRNTEREEAKPASVEKFQTALNGEPDDKETAVDTYTVQSGDTLSGIASRHDATTNDLIELNRDSNPLLAENPDRIRVGDEILVPTGIPSNERSESTPRVERERVEGTSNYTIQAGDTLSAIANRHDTTTNDLVELNRASNPQLAENPNHIRVGEVILVPTASVPTPTPDRDSTVDEPTPPTEIVPPVQPEAEAPSIRNDNNLDVHVTERGDTLRWVAAKHDVDPFELIKVNLDADSRVISEEQKPIYEFIVQNKYLGSEYLDHSLPIGEEMLIPHSNVEISTNSNIPAVQEAATALNDNLPALMNDLNLTPDEAATIVPMVFGTLKMESDNNSNSGYENWKEWVGDHVDWATGGNYNTSTGPYQINPDIHFRPGDELAEKYGITADSLKDVDTGAIATFIIFAREYNTQIKYSGDQELQDNWDYYLPYSYHGQIPSPNERIHFEDLGYDHSNRQENSTNGQYAAYDHAKETTRYPDTAMYVWHHYQFSQDAPVAVKLS